MNPSRDDPQSPTFHHGDEVVLAKGSYVGTRGVFICFREDVRWAEITESNGVARRHPVEWLEHCVCATPHSGT